MRWLVLITVVAMSAACAIPLRDRTVAVQDESGPIYCECGQLTCGDRCVAQSYLDNVGCDEVGGRAVEDTSGRCKAALMTEEGARREAERLAEEARAQAERIEDDERVEKAAKVEAARREAEEEQLQLQKEFEADAAVFAQEFEKNKSKVEKRVKKLIKESANDPDSIRDVECFVEDFCITCTFRGKNSFGALVLDSDTACFSRSDQPSWPWN
jgi:hypothetical protein